MRYRGLSGMNGSIMQHNRAWTAFISSRIGHSVSVPAITYTHCTTTHHKYHIQYPLFFTNLNRNSQWYSVTWNWNMATRPKIRNRNYSKNRTD